MIIGKSLTALGGGGLKPEIRVTAKAGALLNLHFKNSSIILQSYQLGASETTHTFVVSVSETAYVVDDATNGKSVEVLVDVVAQYNVEIDYKLWLYKDGNQYEELTGGFIQTTTGNYYNYQFTGNVNFNTDNIYVSVDSTGRKLPFVNTANKIDFSGYSKIKVEYFSATGGTNYPDRKSAIWLTSEIGKDSMQNYQKVYKQIPDGSGTLETDISTVNTSYYFVISTDADVGIHANISKVWIE